MSSRRSNNEEENEDFDYEQDFDPDLEENGEEQEEQQQQQEETEQITEEGFSDLLNATLDHFFEKKFNKSRGEIFHKLSYNISRHYFPEQLIKVEDSLMSNITKSLKNSKNESEFIHALRTLSILLFSVIGEKGDNEGSNIFSDFFPILSPIAKDVSRSAQIRSSTLEALGILCFLCSCEREEIRKTIETLRSVFQTKTSKPPTSVVNSSLNSLSLVLTHIDLKMLREEYLFPPTTKESNTMSPVSLSVSIFKTLFYFLENSETSTRKAAGETLALVFSLDRVSSSNEGWSKRYCSYINPEKLEEELTKLSKERNKYQTKKDLQDQRKAFRNISESIMFGNDPEEVMTISGQKVRLSGWESILRAHFIRKVYASSFPYQLKYNDTLQEMLSITLDKNYDQNNLSHNDKRVIMTQNSQISRERTKIRNKQRNQRSKQTQKFPHGDDDDE